MEIIIIYKFGTSNIIHNSICVIVFLSLKMPSFVYVPLGNFNFTYE